MTLYLRNCPNCTTTQMPTFMTGSEGEPGATYRCDSCGIVFEYKGRITTWTVVVPSTAKPVVYIDAMTVEAAAKEAVLHYGAVFAVFEGHHVSKIEIAEERHGS